ncbi:site-specific recombination directionality factor RDF [Mycobacterium phage Anthony]|uniref:Lipoprotein n=1 Tax=Mycobacterium phage Anthony TaxID=2599857 RepID=A0A5J6TKV2_9CAUD|nr:site-specific recombination directionality factor RDF [Mycobacterium phage Anthony]QFG10429.1 hypothetical protein PBI_ANTHONY_59 [Mycobacterium phage Anthony]
MKKIVATAIAAAALALGLSACTETDANIGSRNLATASEQFEVPRHIVGINGITDKYLFEMTGYCSISDQATQLEAICKDEDGSLRKTILGKSDNTTYVVRDLDSSKVSTKHIRVIFKPETLIPDFDRP